MIFSILFIISLINAHPLFSRDVGDDFDVKTCGKFTSSPFKSYSCQNDTRIPESEYCCFETKGLFLLTQFYDYNPDYVTIAKNGTDEEKKAVDVSSSYSGSIRNSSGVPVEESFTLHGLWNDRCDGTWDEYCAPGLEVDHEQDNITDIIVNKFNKPELYDKMVKYFINTEKSNVDDQKSIALWEHEYNKHGTCMNTIEPGCFYDYQEFEAAVGYWDKAMSLWEGLNTYDVLAEAGIVPTVEKTYALSDIQKALSDFHGGKEVYISCENDNIFEVWYYYNILGNVIEGDFKKQDMVGESSCPEQVYFVPK